MVLLIKGFRLLLIKTIPTFFSRFISTKKESEVMNMAGILMRMGDRPNINICEYAVDTIEEVELLPTTTTIGVGKFSEDASFKFRPPIGSTCIVGNGDEELLVYMLFSNGWKKL